MSKFGGVDKLNIIGIRSIQSALESKHPIEKIWVSKDYKSSFLHGILRISKSQNIPIQFVPHQKLKYLVKSDRVNIVARASIIDYLDFQDFLETRQVSVGSSLYLLLDGITDVRNFGAIIRTAVATNVTAIVVPYNRSASINADTVRASSGGVFKIPITRVNHLRDAVYLLREHKIKVLGLDEKASDVIYETCLKGSIALVVGAEDRGISKGVLNVIESTIRLPISDSMPSLNVSVACGVALYETMRQRTISNINTNREINNPF